MPMPVKECPKCGAMIVPQLVRCRQCKTYLHGTRIEGFLIENLIPAQVQRAPGTATLVLLICLFYGLMIALGGRTSLIGFSAFTLRQLGAVSGTEVLLGQYWRFVTSIFGHADLLHLAFNLSMLVYVGELVERIFDRKKMLLLYLIAGVTSMAISFAWSFWIRGVPYATTIGASGAVCGMLGAAWFGARKLGPKGADIVSRMKRSAVIMVVWGLAVPGIDNAAHFGGFAVGALLAHLMPAGFTQTVNAQRVLSVVTLAAFAGVLACVGLMVLSLRGYPVVLENDAQPRSILGFTYYQGYDAEFSGQKFAWDACAATQDLQTPTDVAIHKCELARRAVPQLAGSYLLLAKHLAGQGDVERAERLMSIADRL